MTPAENKVISKLLDLAYDLSDHGCNAFYLEDTPENRSIVEAMGKWMDEDETREVRVHDGKICTQDWMLMYYFAEKLEAE
jgi:hypothetical protein